MVDEPKLGEHSFDFGNDAVLTGPMTFHNAHLLPNGDEEHTAGYFDTDGNRVVERRWIETEKPIYSEWMKDLLLEKQNKS